MANLGITLGAATQQMNNRRQQQQEARRVGLGERRLQFEQDQQQTERRQQIRQQSLEDFTTVVEDVTNFAANASADPGDPAIQQYANDQIRHLEDRATLLENTDPQGAADLRARIEGFRARIPQIPTALSAARTEAAGEVVGAEEVARRLNVPVEEAARGAGLLPAPSEPNVRNYFNAETGEFVLIDEAAPGASARIAALPRGSFRAGSPTVQSESIAALTGDPATGTSPERIEQARESLRNFAENIDQIDRAITALQQTPNAVGLVGSLVENVGGIIDQFGVGEAALRAFGLDAGQISAVRADLRRVAAASIEQITGEESGRISEAEREMAQRASASLRATNSLNQATETLRLTHEIERRRMARIAWADFIRPEGIDLSTDEGLERAVEIMQAQGFDERAALRAVGDVLTFRDQGFFDISEGRD